MYNEGISKYGDLLDLAVKLDMVSKSGTWYSYMDERLGQGRETAKVYLKENQDFANELELKVRTKLGLIDTEEEKEEK